MFSVIDCVEASRCVSTLSAKQKEKKTLHKLHTYLGSARGGGGVSVTHGKRSAHGFFTRPYLLQYCLSVGQARESKRSGSVHTTHTYNKGQLSRFGASPTLFSDLAGLISRPQCLKHTGLSPPSAAVSIPITRKSSSWLWLHRCGTNIGTHSDCTYGRGAAEFVLSMGAHAFWRTI